MKIPSIILVRTYTTLAGPMALCDTHAKSINRSIYSGITTANYVECRVCGRTAKDYDKERQALIQQKRSRPSNVKENGDPRPL